MNTQYIDRSSNYTSLLKAFLDLPEFSCIPPFTQEFALIYQSINKGTMGSTTLVTGLPVSLARHAVYCVALDWLEAPPPAVKEEVIKIALREFHGVCSGIDKKKGCIEIIRPSHGFLQRNDAIQQMSELFIPVDGVTRIILLITGTLCNQTTNLNALVANTKSHYADRFTCVPVHGLTGEECENFSKFTSYRDELTINIEDYKIDNFNEESYYVPAELFPDFESIIHLFVTENTKLRKLDQESQLLDCFAFLSSLKILTDNKASFPLVTSLYSLFNEHPLVHGYLNDGDLFHVENNVIRTWHRACWNQRNHGEFLELVKRTINEKPQWIAEIFIKDPLHSSKLMLSMKIPFGNWSFYLENAEFHLRREIVTVFAAFFHEYREILHNDSSTAFSLDTLTPEWLQIAVKELLKTIFGEKNKHILASNFINFLIDSGNSHSTDPFYELPTNDPKESHLIKVRNWAYLLITIASQSRESLTSHFSKAGPPDIDHIQSLFVPAFEYVMDQQNSV